MNALVSLREAHAVVAVQCTVRRVTSRLFKILFTEDFEYAELQNGLVMILWGLWMLLFTEPDAAFVEAYRAMLSQAPEALWASLFLLIGVTKLYALLWEVTPLRKAASMLAFVYWFFTFLTIAVASPYTFAVPVTFIFSVSAVWSHVRVSGDKKNNGRSSSRPGPA